MLPSFSWPKRTQEFKCGFSMRRFESRLTVCIDGGRGAAPVILHDSFSIFLGCGFIVEAANVKKKIHSLCSIVVDSTVHLYESNIITSRHQQH